MRVIATDRLEKFWRKHRTAKRSLERWFVCVKNAEWKKSADIPSTWPKVDTFPVAGTRVTVFDVGGNKYRVITSIQFDPPVVVIRFVLTHNEYSQENWKRRL